MAVVSTITYEQSTFCNSSRGNCIWKAIDEVVFKNYASTDIMVSLSLMRTPLDRSRGTSK